MTKLINCKIRLSKKAQEQVHSIERVGNEYTIELNKGFKFSWDTTCAIEYNQKDVMEAIKGIKEIEESERGNYYHVLATIDENNKVENEINSHEIQLKEHELIGQVVYNYLTDSDFENTRKQFSNVDEIISHMKLDKSHFGNFKNMRNGAIFGTLKRYENSRYDLVYYIETYLYGINTKTKNIA